MTQIYMRYKNAGLYKGSVNNRKSYIHLKKELKSGKVAHLFLRRRAYRGDHYYENAYRYRWGIGLIIANNDKEARMWWRGKINKTNTSTGDGSLEALIWAFRQLDRLKWEMLNVDGILVKSSNEQRARVYAYLAKHEKHRNEKYDVGWKIQDETGHVGTAGGKWWWKDANNLWD